MSTETAHHTAMTLADHLPALQVLIPFLAGPLIVLIGGRRLAWPAAVLASAASFVVAAMLLSRVIDGSVISYHMGGWAPPLGIEYRVDAANAFVLLLVSAMSTLVLLYARESVNAEVSARHHTLFYTAFLLCLSGLLGVAVTGDAFNVFVFLEISSLATYVLIAQGSERDKRALTASYDYLIMGTIGATFFVIGIGFLYMATGTLNMADLAKHLKTELPSYAVPLFVRLRPEIAVTATMKHQKVKLRQEGMELDKVADPLYILEGGTYVPLTADRYAKITTPGARL